MFPVREGWGRCFQLGQSPNCGERRIVVGPFAKLGCAKRRVWAVGVFVADMNIVLSSSNRNEIGCDVLG